MAKDAKKKAADPQPKASAPAPAAPAEPEVKPAPAAAEPVVEERKPRTLWSYIFGAVEGLIILAIFAYAARVAYETRLFAVKTYGRVIHEFDPWFNFRATQYLADNGLRRFFKWYDYDSWYPLGRPVGTTIYPGMQMTSVLIWRTLRLDFWKDTFGVDPRMSLNDVCVFVPAWFGAIASLSIGLLTREVSGSWRSAAAAVCFMAVVPAHMMRSVGGGYDNESIAMTAMVLTFFLWCRSIRTPSSWPIGILAGLAYAYMVAAWGGYIFVVNMIGVHCAALVLLGHFTPSLHKAYSLWFIVGTSIAVQVPVVGWSPFRSLEQVGPLLVFLGLQFLAFTDYIGHSRGYTWENNKKQMWKIRVEFATKLGVLAVIPLAVLVQTGYFGPLSVRVRSLFVKHTRTGNPLVDSVAEHQPGSAEAYWHYLHYCYYLAPIGFVLAFFKSSRVPHFGLNVNKYFIILFALVAYYFANRMSRLIILAGPVASVLAGMAVGSIGSWALSQPAGLISALISDQQPVPHIGEEKKEEKKQKKVSEHVLAKWGLRQLIPLATKLSHSAVSTRARFKSVWDHPLFRIIRVTIAISLVFSGYKYGNAFWKFSTKFAEDASHPHIMFKARLQNGREVMINDYQEAYWWLRDNTPKDSRVLAWWDYGYQINGIAKRASLADGNTWNLEHIAFIGRILTAPQKKAHSIARHVADYVLIWAGGHSDDLQKSPHMARIASSVYTDVCPSNDPMCHTFGFHHNHQPTPSMAKSMLYRMHSNGQGNVRINKKLFEEMYTSRHGLVRIYKILNVSQESKAWAADPANRICDAPGSWYCVGQYPPAVKRPPSTHRHIDYDNPTRHV